MSRLISETEKLLRIAARDVDDTTQAEKIVKKLLEACMALPLALQSSGTPMAAVMAKAPVSKQFP